SQPPSAQRPQLQMAKLQPVPQSAIWQTPAQPRTAPTQAQFRNLQQLPASIPAQRPTLRPAPAPLPTPKPAQTRVEPKPSPKPATSQQQARPEPPVPAGHIATARQLLNACEYLGREPLVYKFGSNDTDKGGLDCSGAIQTLLKRIGYSSVPRTSYDQYRWLEEHGKLRKARRGTPASKILNDLRPGQLIFWKGTYKTSKPVTHVMVYLGKSKTGQHYMFGARGTKKKGLHGNGVDVFTFNFDSNKNNTPIVGYGDIPKLAYLY
ncbi:MAG: NlpC/P60 family protein, partial [Verrucomicrobiota bacterium]